MPDHEEDILTNHEYDGIQEFDNPLPGWWKWLFWGSFFFSIAYATWYHVRPGNTVLARYNANVAAFYENQLEKLGISEPSNEAVLQIMENQDVMAAMSRLFAGNCGQCHRADGGGNIGPNLTDTRYKWVKEPLDIYESIANGIPNTSMPAWSDRLRQPQMLMLAAYVASMRGTNVSGGKSAEGQEIPAWSTYLSDDASSSAGSDASNESAP